MLMISGVQLATHDIYFIHLIQYCFFLSHLVLIFICTLAYYHIYTFKKRISHHLTSQTSFRLTPLSIFNSQFSILNYSVFHIHVVIPFVEIEIPFGIFHLSALKIDRFATWKFLFGNKFS